MVQRRRSGFKSWRRPPIAGFSLRTCKGPPLRRAFAASPSREPTWQQYRLRRLAALNVIAVLPDPLPSLAKRGDLPKTFARWGQRAGDMRGGGGSGHVIVNQHFAINTPDANSLKRSQGQIATELAMAGRRALARR
jgi:hypothetical protein